MPAILTVAESLSIMSIESLAVDTVICGSATMLSMLMITVSVASTMASSITGTVIVANVVPAVIVTLALRAV